jgi:hypothetical protein
MATGQLSVPAVKRPHFGVKCRSPPPNLLVQCVTELWKHRICCRFQEAPRAKDKALMPTFPSRQVLSTVTVMCDRTLNPQSKLKLYESVYYVITCLWLP